MIEDVKRINTLNLILDEGPISTSRVGKELGISATAARKRLEPFVKDGLVDERWEIREGKNTRFYSITEKGRDFLLEADRKLLQELREKEKRCYDIIYELGGRTSI